MDNNMDVNKNPPTDDAVLSAINTICSPDLTLAEARGIYKVFVDLPGKTEPRSLSEVVSDVILAIASSTSSTVVDQIVRQNLLHAMVVHLRVKSMNDSVMFGRVVDLIHQRVVLSKVESIVSSSPAWWPGIMKVWEILKIGGISQLISNTPVGTGTSKMLLEEEIVTSEAAMENGEYAKLESRYNEDHSFVSTCFYVILMCGRGAAGQVEHLFNETSGKITKKICGQKLYSILCAVGAVGFSIRADINNALKFIKMSEIGEGRGATATTRLLQLFSMDITSNFSVMGELLSRVDMQYAEVLDDLELDLMQFTNLDEETLNLLMLSQALGTRMEFLAMRTDISLRTSIIKRKGLLEKLCEFLHRSCTRQEDETNLNLRTFPFVTVDNVAMALLLEDASDMDDDYEIKATPIRAHLLRSGYLNDKWRDHTGLRMKECPATRCSQDPEVEVFCLHLHADEVDVRSEALKAIAELHIKKKTATLNDVHALMCSALEASIIDVTTLFALVRDILLCESVRAIQEYRL